MIDPALQSLLREAIHGGPAPSEQELGQALIVRGVRFPCGVMASHDPEEVSSRPIDVELGIPLRVHAGLVYWLTQTGADLARSLEGQKIIHGPEISCASVALVVAAIQRAIVAMRELELARLRDELGDDPGFGVEQDLAGMVVQQVRQRDAANTETARVWCELMLWRHRHHLNTMRYKCVEIYTALSRDLDHHIDLGSAMRQAILTMYEAFALEHIQRAFMTAVAALAAVRAKVAGQRLPDNPVLVRAFAYIERAFQEPISLGTVADNVGISATYLAHLCRREIGCTIVEHIQHTRIRHAQELLKTTTDDLLTIALASGFPSPEHFHRLFKRTVGQTPRHYRLTQRR